MRRIWGIVGALALGFVVAPTSVAAFCGATACDTVDEARETLERATEPLWGSAEEPEAKPEPEPEPAPESSRASDKHSAHDSEAPVEPAEALVQFMAPLLAQASSGVPTLPPVLATLPLLNPEPSNGEPEPAGPEAPIGPMVPAAWEAAVVPNPGLGAAPAAFVGAVAGATLGSLAVPGWRSASVRILSRLGSVVLFTRLDESQIVSHRRRSDILEFVRRNPGERVEAMRQTLGLTNGTLLYHLRVLENADLVRMRKEGSVARLFPAGPRIRAEPYLPPLRRRIMALLESTPGPTQRQLALRLQLSERMISYHVRRLERQGFLRVERTTLGKSLFSVRSPAEIPAAVLV